MKVYLDLVIITNFLLDYCLIIYTGIINHQIIKYYRIILASLYAVGGFVLFLIPVKIIFVILRIIYSFGIILIAFKNTSFKQYCQNLIIFYFLNYVIAGILVSYEFSLLNNGITLLYKERTTWYLLIISFLFANIFTYVYKIVTDNSKGNNLVKVKFSLLNEEYEVYGFTDTGNLTYSANDYLPVVFINKALVPVTINETLLQLHGIKYTYIITNTINGQSRLLGFKPQSFYVVKKKKYYEKEVYLVLVDESIFRGEKFAVILHPQILN